MGSLIGFFESGWFKYFAFPVLCAVGTVIFRSITREDKQNAFRSEDWMIGLELIWLSVTILAAGISEKVSQYRLAQKNIELLTSSFSKEDLQKIDTIMGLDKTADSLISMLSASGFVMFSYVFVAVCTSVFVRQFGWNGPSNPRRFRGIVLPMFLGLLMLALSMRFLTVGNFA